MEAVSSQGFQRDPRRTPWKDYAGAPVESKGTKDGRPTNPQIKRQEEQRLRQEYAAAMAVKKALHKVKTASEENRDALIEELELVHAMKLEEMGSQAEKVGMEVDKTLGEIMSGEKLDGSAFKKARSSAPVEEDVSDYPELAAQLAARKEAMQQKAREHAAAYEVRKVIQSVRNATPEERDMRVEELIKTQSDHLFAMGSQADLVGLEVDRVLADIYAELEKDPEPEPEFYAPPVAKAQPVFPEAAPKAASTQVPGWAAHTVGWAALQQQQQQLLQQHALQQGQAPAVTLPAHAAKAGFLLGGKGGIAKGAFQTQGKGGLQGQQPTGTIPLWLINQQIKGAQKGGVVQPSVVQPRPFVPRPSFLSPELQGVAQPETAGQRAAELKRKRDEESHLRSEHAAALVVRKAIMKVKNATPENRDQLVEELEMIHAENVEAMGSQAEKVAGEVDKAMEAVYASLA